MGMGFENSEMGFGKKMNWEMGLVPTLPFQDTRKTYPFTDKLKATHAN